MFGSWLVERIESGRNYNLLRISKRSNGYCYKEYYEFYEYVKKRISIKEYEETKKQMTSTPNHRIITPK